MTGPAMAVIASITKSPHRDDAQVVISVGLLRQIERQLAGGPIAQATSAPALHITGASA